MFAHISDQARAALAIASNEASARQSTVDSRFLLFGALRSGVVLASHGEPYIDADDVLAFCATRPRVRLRNGTKVGFSDEVRLSIAQSSGSAASLMNELADTDPDLRRVLNLCAPGIFANPGVAIRFREETVPSSKPSKGAPRVISIGQVGGSMRGSEH